MQKDKRDQKDMIFMQVGDFVAGFGGNELEHTDDLTGRTLDIHFDTGCTVRYRFMPDRRLEWRVLAGSGFDQKAAKQGLESYRATCLRDGYFLVDFISSHQPAQTVSLLVDLIQNIATMVEATMPTREETLKPLFQRVLDKELLTPVRATIAHGALDCRFGEDTPIHEPTEDLIGKRVRYQYGKKDAYEHIYLSSRLYTWNCIQGPEAGLADTDYCRYYRVADDFYLFVWLEKIIPTVGLVLIDFHQKKTSGKIFGYQDGDFGATCNTPVGAYLSIQNQTRYDHVGN